MGLEMYLVRARGPEKGRCVCKARTGSRSSDSQPGPLLLHLQGGPVLRNQLGRQAASLALIGNASDGWDLHFFCASSLRREEYTVIRRSATLGSGTDSNVASFL